MAKKGSSSNKSSNLGGENLNKIESNNTSTVFSWHLNQKKLDLEDNILLHKRIDFSCESLQKFKDGVWQELLFALDEKFKGQETINSLIDTTETQIDKNDEINKRKIGKVIEKFESKRKEERSKKKGTELIQILQEINNQENEELAGIKPSLDDLNKPQTDLRKQEKFLNLLTSNEIWETFLSMPEEEAPRINFNIGWTPYKITKWEKYEGEGWELDIKNAIADKMDDDLYTEEFQNFVLRFILNPFKVWERYDEETINYYVNSVIECINDDKKGIVQEIWKLYNERKKLEESLSNFRNLLNEDYTQTIDRIRKIMESKPSKPNFSLNDVLDLKKNFISFLKKESIDGNIGYWDWYQNVIENISMRSGKLDSYKTDDFRDYNNFIILCSRIWEYLWVELDRKKRATLSTIFNDMKKNFIWKKQLSIFDEEACLENIKRGVYKESELSPFIKNLENLEEIIKGKRDAIRKGKRWKGTPDKLDLYSKFRDSCRRIQYVDLDYRKKDIENCFKEVFGVSAQWFGVEDVKDGKTLSDETLMKKMVKALIDEINEKYVWLSGKLDNRLWRKQSEEDILYNIDRVLENLLYNDFNDFDYNSYNEKKWKRLEMLNNVESQLDECWSKEGYEKIRQKIKEILEDEFLTQLGEYGERLDLCKNWGTYSLSGIDRDNVGIKWLLGLKKLFNCDKLTLAEKFDYSKIILSNISKNSNSRIRSKKSEHDEILESLFREENVIRKCEKQKEETDETVNNDSEFRKKEKEFLKNLQDLRWMISSDEDKMDFYGVFISGLENFWLSDSQGNELRDMQNKFPEAVDLYIDSSIEEWVLKFEKARKTAINYNNWTFDFSVIQAWILEKAVEKWNLKNVLEYLWFFTNKDFDIPEKALNNEDLRNTIKWIIQLLQEWVRDSGKQRMIKYWCFSDEYPNGNRQRLRFQDNSLINIKKWNWWAYKFGIWKKDDQFRIVGLRNSGLYAIYYYFETNTQHDKGYKWFLNGGVSKNDKEIFRECTGIDFDGNDKS